MITYRHSQTCKAYGQVRASLFEVSGKRDPECKELKTQVFSGELQTLEHLLECLARRRPMWSGESIRARVNFKAF